LGLSATEFGVLLSAFSLSYGFAQLPSGMLLDRFGPRIVLGAGLIFGRDAGPDRDGQLVLAFYSAAHWSWHWRSAVYARGREIDQRLVCAKERGTAVGIFNSSTVLGRRLRRRRWC
jgi:MFS family permease